MSDLLGDDTLAPGALHRDYDPLPRRDCDDDDEPEPHHAGDDDMGPPDGPVLRRHQRPEPEEPERLACRQCGKPWDEPRLSPDGVCPLCRIALDEQ